MNDTTPDAWISFPLNTFATNEGTAAARAIMAVLDYYLPDYDCDLADGLVGRALDKLDDAVMLDEGTLPAIYNAHLQLAADLFNQAVVLYVGLLPEVEAA